MTEFLGKLDVFWIWLTVAFMFLAIEVLIVPSGFFLCLGTAAGVLAVVTFFVPDLTWLWAVSIYSVVLVVTGYAWWGFFRKHVRKNKSEAENLNVKTAQLIGYTGLLSSDMKAGRGRMRVNDSPWSVTADEDYPSGTKVKVVDVTGITLKVAKVD
ncbi:NfeD family protein [Desulfovibrio sp. OttesenSCG-928-A18]|nr:NfeD family protein [Desulfovibrio sp. OttesenSCG-928-A18]